MTDYIIYMTLTGGLFTIISFVSVLICGLALCGNTIRALGSNDMTSKGFSLLITTAYIIGVLYFTYNYTLLAVGCLVWLIILLLITKFVVL